MAKVMILSTGGTIAMDQTTTSSHPVPSLEGQDFRQQLEARLRGEVEVDTRDIIKIPSSHIRLKDIQNIFNEIERHSAQPDCEGIVVTHGTDTIEESAYFSHLCYAGSKPVVFTGAMRSANEVGYEGLRNLISSVRVACCQEARDLGVLIVMNEQVHSAAEVRKLHTQRVDAFQSPPYGPLGEVAFQKVSFKRQIVRPGITLKPLYLTPVPLIALTADVELSLLEAAQKTQPKGIVLEALGGGRVPPKIVPVLEDWVNSGLPVVVATRSGIGPVLDEYGYPGGHRHLQRIGCYFAHHLSGPRARVKLMLALGNEMGLGTQLRLLFEGEN